MNSSILFMILLQFVLIFFNAIFACAEIAVISMNDNKLAKMAAAGDKRAIRLARLTSQPARFLATIQVAITLSGFLGSAFAADNFSGILVDWLIGLGVTIPTDVLDTIAVIIITIVLSYITLVLGELVPKQIAMRKAEALALGMSGLINAVAKIFAPLVSFLTVSTNAILRLLGIDPNEVNEQVGEEEIRMMVDVGSEKGTIDLAEREFIQNVFEFDDLSAKELVTHRIDVVMLDVKDTMEIWKEIIIKNKHTYYPICEDTADEIIGVLNTNDYFRLEVHDRENIMKYAVRPAYFVPDTIKADVLFRNMKKEKQKLAIVLDEYGGMTGIITMSDLLEELVGDLGNDDFEEELIKALGNNTWKIHGSALLEDVSSALNVTFPSIEYDTFNGLIFHTLGRVPQKGSDLEIEICGLTIKIVEMVNHHVKMAEVRLKTQPSDN